MTHCTYIHKYAERMKKYSPCHATKDSPGSIQFLPTMYNESGSSHKPIFPGHSVSHAKSNVTYWTLWPRTKRRPILRLEEDTEKTNRPARVRRSRVDPHTWWQTMRTFLWKALKILPIVMCLSINSPTSRRGNLATEAGFPDREYRPTRPNRFCTTSRAAGTLHPLRLRVSCPTLARQTSIRH